MLKQLDKAPDNFCVTCYIPNLEKHVKYYDTHFLKI